jgi:DNA repair protein RecO (recombination protein O)
MLIKDQAICIRAVDYSETSQVVTFLARDLGKVGAMAKGAKRPKSAFGGPIEMFSHGEMVLTDHPHAKLATLTEYQPRYDVVRGLSANLSAYHAAILATELVDKLTQDRDPHQGLYDGFLVFLQEAVTIQTVLPTLIRFQWVLLREIGLQPVLDACVNCRLPYAPTWPACYFSSSANGLVCRDCEGAFEDRMSLIPAVARAMTGSCSLDQADRKVLGAMERLLIGHFTNLLHHRPKTAGYVIKAL